MANKVELDLKSGLIDLNLNTDIENFLNVEKAIKQYKNKIIMKEIKIPDRLISMNKF